MTTWIPPGDTMCALTPLTHVRSPLTCAPTPTQPPSGRERTSSQESTTHCISTATRTLSHQTSATLRLCWGGGRTAYPRTRRARSPLIKPAMPVSQRPVWPSCASQYAPPPCPPALPSSLHGSQPFHGQCRGPASPPSPGTKRRGAAAGPLPTYLSVLSTWLSLQEHAQTA